MNAVIFGAAGQDGFYLTKLQQLQVDVIAVPRSAGFIYTDITDYAQVHAANSTAGHEGIFENHAAISTGTLNILKAVKNSSPHTRVFIPGSTLQFKNEQKLIKEADAFEARDAYSVSRIQSVYAARYFRSLGMNVYVGYFFNHDSPLLTERHMCKKISEACKRIAKGMDFCRRCG